jgi:8-oxo-dGTP pyrophosphatase MutT (NUDIX family)
MAEKITHTVLGMIEKPDTFVMQLRPNLPGRLAYPGKIHFFGGHLNPLEAPYTGLIRELREETDLDLPSAPAGPELWSGRFMGEDKRGLKVLRHITLFGLAEHLEADERVLVNKSEGGATIEIAKDLQAVKDLEDLMAPFAFQALGSYLTHGEVRIGE